MTLEIVKKVDTESEEIKMVEQVMQMLALKMEGPSGQGILQPPGAGESKETGSPLGPSETDIVLPKPGF
jgi:hypothetical protein